MHTKLTEEQLNRLSAARAAGEPVPTDIRDIVIANYEFDGSESDRRMDKLLDVIRVDAKPDYTLNLTFENGEKRVFDMNPLMNKKPFVRLKGSSLFMKAFVDYGTVAWPCGIDIAPETLYDLSIPMEDGTILKLTDEQIPRFVEAAKAGKGLPPDIVASFMAQLFPDEQHAYEQDDGPLTETELNQVRVQAAPKLGKGPVLRRRSLLEDSDD